MNKDLTTSISARRHVLNNICSLPELDKYLGLSDPTATAHSQFTKRQAAEILGVDERTIDRYLCNHRNELIGNGYRNLFTYRALLNLAMLVTESEQARAIRSRMLDIALDVIAQRTGGQTKYITPQSPSHRPTTNAGDSYGRPSNRNTSPSDISPQTRRLLRVLPAVEGDYEDYLAAKSQSLGKLLMSPEIRSVFERLAAR